LNAGFGLYRFADADCRGAQPSDMQQLRQVPIFRDK
jgi:hypothetical protein